MEMLLYQLMRYCHQSQGPIILSYICNYMEIGLVWLHIYMKFACRRDLHWILICYFLVIIYSVTDIVYCILHEYSWLSNIKYELWLNWRFVSEIVWILILNCFHSPHCTINYPIDLVTKLLQLCLFAGPHEAGRFKAPR